MSRQLVLRRILVPVTGALLALASVPVGADAIVDRRATPTMTVTVTPRYPQLGATARVSVRVSGAYGPATGWVRMRFNGAVIAGCRHVVLTAGAATCTAPRSWRSKRKFVVGYKGSAVYKPKVAVRYAWS